MPNPVVRTYGKRGNSSSGAVLKRKPTSELVDDELDLLAGPSNIPKSGTGLPEKRRRVEASSASKKDEPTGAMSTASSTRPTSPTKLSQRMLGRSRTESSITEDSPTIQTRRTPSLPTLNASPKAEAALSQSKDTHRPTFISPIRATASYGASTSTSANPIKTSRTTVTRTYAGQSRSFLMPLSSYSGDPSQPQLSQPEEIDDEFSRESYASLRERWGVDNTSEDEHFYDPIAPSRDATPSSATPSPTKSQTGRARPKFAYSQGSPSKSRSRKDGSPSKSQLPPPPPLPSNMMNPLKSITELRNKGESRRFLDEVAYLLDGMSMPKPSATSGSKAAPNYGLIRASALELINKLSETDFSRKAKAADIYGRVYELLVDAGAGRGTDKVLDTLLLTFLVLLAREPTALIEIAETYPASSTYSPISTRPNTPNPISRSISKGKCKSPSTPPDTASRSLVDILFTLVHFYAPSTSEDPEDELPPTDPLVLSSSETYTDAHFKRAGIGKKERGMVIGTLHNALSSLSLPGSKLSGKKHTALNTPSIATSLIHLLPPSLLPPNAWRADCIVKSVNDVLSSVLNSRPSNSSKLKRWFTSVPTSDWYNLHMQLRLLDLYLLNQWGTVEGEVEEPKNEKAWKTMVDRLLSLGQAVPYDAEEEGEGTCIATQCLETLLRILVTLTHGNEAWAKRVVAGHKKGPNASQLAWLTSLVMESGSHLKLAVDQGKVADVKARQVKKAEEEDEDAWWADKNEDAGTEPTETDDEDQSPPQLQTERRARALDKLCLALALLTNLVQVLDNMGELMEASGTLEALGKVYEQQGEVSEEEAGPEGSEEEIQGREQAHADASFLRGHLAVLFGLLMQQNEENKERILQLLPRRGESWRLKLTRLVDQAKRFVSFFDVVQASQREEGLNEDEKNEKKLAQEVVGFLVEIRDEC